MGHAKGHLREQFRDLLEEYYNVSDDLGEIAAVEDRFWPLTGKLWNCTDMLPASYRDYVDWLIESADDDVVRLWKHSGTYGKAARIIRDLIASDREARTMKIAA